MGNYMDSS